MKNLKVVFKAMLLLGLIYLLISKFWNEIPFPHAVYLVANYVVFLLAANLTVDLLSWVYRRRKQYPSNKKDNVLTGLENLYYLTVTGATIMAILGFWNIDIRTLFTTLSIVAAAIAIISKDYLAEIISGIIISFSNILSIDDYVKIGEYKGKILDITLTKIALLNEDDDVVFLPNNKVFLGEIINFTKRAIRKVNIDFEMDMKFLKTIEELETNLVDCLNDYHSYIEPDSFNLKIVTINKESLFLKFQFKLHEIDRDIEREVRRKTVRRVVNYIKETKVLPDDSSN